MNMDTREGPSGGFRSFGRTGQRGGRGGGRGYQDRNYQQDYSSGRGGRGSGRHNSNWNQQSDGGRGGRMGRGYWGNDQRGSGRGRGRGRSRGRGRVGGLIYNDPDDVQFVRSLKGHEDVVTDALLDSANNQLYTGSKDCTVRVWNLFDGECTSKVDVGGSVDCLLLQGGFLFVGIHPKGDDVAKSVGAIRIWDVATGAEQQLAGPQGNVLTMLLKDNMLFSGSNDSATTIHVWKGDPATKTFAPQAALGKAQGGHTFPVQALVMVGSFLFSADWGGCIKVWDLIAGNCVQTIEDAHESVIMNLIQWQENLLSCSLDGTVKVWQAVEVPAPGAVLEAAPVYVHPPAGVEAPYGGVLAMAGALDAKGKPVLLASHNEDRVIRLWELPTFAERGELSAVHDARALVAGDPGIILSGDRHGTVKMWKWK